MRYWGLIIMLGASSACYVGPLGGGDDSTTGDTTAEEDASSNPGGSSDPTSMSGPTGSSDSVGETSAGSTSDAMDGSTSSPVDGSESSSGEMSGCEGGPLAAPIPGCAPVAAPSSGDIAQDCVDRINQFRWECQCLPPLARWSEAESCSDSQSSADQNGGGPHGNFGMCGENAQNTCPNWGSEQQIITGCLQAMWDEGPGEPFSAHGHYINMSSTNYSRVACGFSSSGAGVWANQNFSP